MERVTSSILLSDADNTFHGRSEAGELSLCMNNQWKPPWLGDRLVVLLVCELKLNGSLRWKVRIMKEKRERCVVQRKLKSLRGPELGVRIRLTVNAGSWWGQQTCLLTFHHTTHIPRLSIQPGCQPFLFKHFSFDISKQHQKDIMGKTGTESDFLTLVLWFLVMLYIHLLWRVDLDTTSGEALQRSNISSLSGEN